MSSVIPHWQSLIEDPVRRSFDRLVFALAFLKPSTHVVGDIMGSLGVSGFASAIETI